MKNTARVRLEPSIDSSEAGWSAFARQIEDRQRGRRLGMSIGLMEASTGVCAVSGGNQDNTGDVHG